MLDFVLCSSESLIFMFLGILLRFIVLIFVISLSHLPDGSAAFSHVISLWIRSDYSVSEELVGKGHIFLLYVPAFSMLHVHIMISNEQILVDLVHSQWYRI